MRQLALYDRDAGCCGSVAEPGFISDLWPFARPCAADRWYHPDRGMPVPGMAVTIPSAVTARSSEELHMTTEMSRQRRESPWASGLTVFAAALLVIGGVWHVCAGIAALVHDEVYLSTPEYVYSFDLTGWGWIQLLLGILAAVAGFAVLRGLMWARIVGVILAALSLLANVAFLAAYPLWSLIMIAMDIVIIMALTVHGSEIKPEG